MRREKACPYMMREGEREAGKGRAREPPSPGEREGKEWNELTSASMNFSLGVGLQEQSDPGSHSSLGEADPEAAVGSMAQTRARCKALPRGPLTPEPTAGCTGTRPTYRGASCPAQCHV